MSNRLCNLLAAILLLSAFLLAFFSLQNDTFTFDETAHIGAGYSYLTRADMRLNPEHPPLIKDLAGLPLLFLKLNFPKDHPSWTQTEPPQWWFQFDFAGQFLYQIGNNPDQILFWSRLPLLFLLVFTGWFLFYFAKKFFGKTAGLLTLFFFSFSPTFLAHGRLVTTDVGAALGVLLSTFFWLKFLKNPDKKNVILAGLIFGIAMLLKFSLITLIPFFGLLTLIYAVLFSEKGKKLKIIAKYLGLAIMAGIIGFIFVVWPVYFYHVFNYPPSRQIRDTQFLLSTTSVPKSLAAVNVWMSKIFILRPFAQYLLGMLLAINRSTTGNTTFFLGQISAKGWKTYFPVVYSLKEPLAFHIFTIISLLYVAWLMKGPYNFEKRSSPNPVSLGNCLIPSEARSDDEAVYETNIRQGGATKPQPELGNWSRKRGLGMTSIQWLKSHFVQFSLIFFIAVYWLTSLTSKLNIGIRHLLPVFPFTFIMVGYLISLWLKPPRLKTKFFVLGFLLVWQAVSVVSVFPHFLAYFNEISGGPKKGYLFVVDSNLDWGQDLKRLSNWLEKNKIDKIYLDYFGGGNAQYYLKEKFVPWWGTKKPEELPKDSYLAVSATQLQGGRADPVNYDGPVNFYRWLDGYTPVAKIGYSIFVYHI